MGAKPTTSTSDSRGWTIREAEDDADLRYIYRRWAGYFGGGGWRQDRGWFRDANASGPADDNWGLLLVAEADGQRVGAAAAWAGEGEHLPETMGYDDVRTDGRAGYLRFATVAPGYRGRGIHGAFVRARIQAVAPDVDRIYTISWVRENHPDSTETFGGGAWNVVDYVEGFYSDETRDYCPDCGRDCDCDAVIWILPADEALEQYGAADEPGGTPAPAEQSET